MEFTTIYCDYGIYSSNKINLKKIMANHELKWNSSKYIELNMEETLSLFNTFGYIDKINNDDNLKNRTSSSGIWENVSSNEAVKVIFLEKRNESEHLPAMLVYKGVEGEFYKEFIKYCVHLGCWISKIIQDEDGFTEIFKKRINVELIEKLEDVELSKSLMKQNFINKINEFKKYGHQFSNDFINGWQECIQKYGYYSLSDLILEIQKK